MVKISSFFIFIIINYYFVLTKASATLNIGPAPAIITKSLSLTFSLKNSVISSKVLM